MPITVSHQDLINQALEHIKTLDVDDAVQRLEQEDTVFVDLRDPRELQREGKIPGAFHAPRGMLEFWVDPASPYFKDIFGEDRTFVFYCQSGWRSALATKAVQDMGMDKVCHIGDGFRGWKDAGAPTEEVPAKK